MDIDDICDGVHGAQQRSLFNTHHGERCFMPIHVYDTATARPVAVLLPSGKPPSAHEVRAHIRLMPPRTRPHWPHPHMTLHGDRHHGRVPLPPWERHRVRGVHRCRRQEAPCNR